MGLRLRFNLVLTAVFATGLASSGFLIYEQLQANARQDVLEKARLMIEVAHAIRSYTVDYIQPELEPYLEQTFLPQTVPAFSATDTLGRLPTDYSEYGYKEATLNPTNPSHRAVDWEADLIRLFRQSGDAPTQIDGVRDTPTGPSLFMASPIRITDQACLACHSTPAAAPASMIALYGESNGFGWKLDEVIGAQIVSVPMSVPIENANRAFVTAMGSLVVVFAVLYLVLNIMLSRMIVGPITHMAKAADAVSTGNFAIPEFAESSRGEVGRLGASFNRMRRSLEQAMKMIES